MRNKIILIIFILVVLAQLYIPASIIIGSESTLNKGSKYLFRTAPIDPNDAFRGKYVQLSFEQSSVKQSNKRNEIANLTAYVEITNDSAGFAKATKLSFNKPSKGDFVAVKTRFSFNDTIMSFEYPFNRFYLEESIAEKAEELYRKNNIRGKQNSYAVVRIKNGTAVIEDLYIGGRPIKESLKQRRD